MFSGTKARLRSFLARKQAVVLAYHSVQRSDVPFPVWHRMSATEFEEQIHAIARWRHIVSLGQLLADSRRARRPSYCVAITFDDGFANNLHVALPVLRRYQAPATFFLTAGFVGSQELLWPERLALILELSSLAALTHRGQELSLSDAAAKAFAYRRLASACKQLPALEVPGYIDELARVARVNEEAIREFPAWQDYRALTWPEVARLASADQVEIGAHSVTHRLLSRLPADQARSEIVESRRLIEAHGHTVRYFAYPNGGAADFADIHRRMVREAGFAAAFTQITGTVDPSVDLFAVPRLGIGTGSTLAQLRYAIQGGVAFSARAADIAPRGL